MQRSSEENPPRIWVRSSYSMTNGNCVEVAKRPGKVIEVRDSKDTEGLILSFTDTGWRLFLGGIRNDGLDLC